MFHACSNIDLCVYMRHIYWPFSMKVHTQFNDCFSVSSNGKQYSCSIVKILLLFCYRTAQFI